MKQVLLHAHIFKNAGTTLDWALQRHFGAAFQANTDEPAMRSGGLEYLQQVLDANPAVRVLSSHHMPALQQQPAGYHCQAMFLLRHPLRRALSVYAFERRQQADTRGAKAAKQFGLRDYLAWRLAPDVPNVLRNYQTAYLAGCHSPLVTEPEMAALVARAGQVLDTTPLVGLVERFDESMVLFEWLLAERFPGIDLAYRIQNRSESGATRTVSKENLSQVLESMGNMADAMAEANRHDLALYARAEAGLDAAIAAVPAFNDKLWEFRNRCNVIPRA